MSYVIDKHEFHAHEDVVEQWDKWGPGIPVKLLAMLSHIMYDDSFAPDRPQGKDGKQTEKFPPHETRLLTTAGADFPIKEDGPSYELVRAAVAVTQETNRVIAEYMRGEPGYIGYSEEEWITLKLGFEGKPFDIKAAGRFFKEAEIVLASDAAVSPTATSVTFGKIIELPFKLEKKDIPSRKGKLQFKTCEVHLGIVDADPKLVDVLLHMGFEYAVMPEKDGTRAHFFTAQSRDKDVMYAAANGLHYLLEELGGFKHAVLQSEIITAHQHHGDVKADKDIAQHVYRIATRKGFKDNLACGSSDEGYTIGEHRAADIKKWELPKKLRQARTEERRNPTTSFQDLLVGKNWADSSSIGKGDRGSGMK